ncbi:MAG: (2Fe-2S)-binding protein [Candidatus Bipolaricaulota bacterium]|nr:(2Fe-2S)-binding protein [Candidatus Bipolaricaulota bacterium]MBS3791819.1 (2Fe-2S)-binding protein [Candidatus Bipolaricaulota bacterium]
MQLEITVNGKHLERKVDGDQRLIDFLREELGFTGVKEGCGVGECGACTVLIDGESVLSCLTRVAQVDGKEVLTVEGLAEGEDLHPVQQAFVETGGVQCGFCTPGFIMVAVELLERNPDPSREEIREWIEGNICRCTGYVKIVDAIELAAERMRTEGEKVGT